MSVVRRRGSAAVIQSVHAILQLQCLVNSGVSHQPAGQVSGCQLCKPLRAASPAREQRPARQRSRNGPPARSTPRRRAQDGVHMPRSQSSGGYDQHPEYHGRFAGIDARPRPLQQPIPLVAGATARRRIAGRSRALTAGTGTGSRPPALPPRSPAFALPRIESSGRPGLASWRSASRPAAG